MLRTSLVMGLLLAGSACTSSKLNVSAVEPATGTVNGGENIIIRGGGFSPGKTSCTVKFGKNDATNVTITAEDKIQVTTPASASGTTDVLVTFDDGRTFKLPGGFYYKSPDQSKTRDVFLSGGKPGAPGAPAPAAAAPAAPAAAGPPAAAPPAAAPAAADGQK